MQASDQLALLIEFNSMLKKQNNQMDQDNAGLMTNNEEKQRKVAQLEQENKDLNTQVEVLAAQIATKENNIREQSIQGTP